MIVLEKHKVQGSAARRKHRQIMSKLMMPSTISFIDQFSFKPGMKGLDMNCGEGDLTTILTQYVGRSGSIQGVSPNKVDVNIANEKIKVSKLNNVTYSYDNLNTKSNENLDFVIGRLLLGQTEYPLQTLSEAYQNMTSGGLILIEDINSRDFHCFPSSYAFERYKELNNKMNDCNKLYENVGSGLIQILEKIGFSNIDIQLVPPSFLSDKFKILTSLKLEGISDQLINKKLATSMEIQSLLDEIKSFEQKENTMISFPSIYQISAIKP